MYLVVTRHSNGYRCSCCRSEWEQTDERDYASDEEALACAKLVFNDEEGVGELKALYRAERLFSDEEKT